MDKTIEIAKEIFSYLVILAVTFLVVKFVYAHFFEPIRVDGASMEYTLQDGNRLFMFKRTDLERFDVIVFPNPRSLARYEALQDEDPDKAKQADVRLNIKRIIGMPGDTIVFQDDQLVLNDQPMQEPYLADKQAEHEGLFTRDFDLETLTGQSVVPQGHLFVMGDNRRNSTDSRSYGFVEIDTVMGEANTVFWPLNQMRMLDQYTLTEDGSQIVQE